MSLEQKKLSVPEYYLALVKAAAAAGYPMDSPILIELFKKHLTGGLARAVKNQGVASLKLQMMKVHPASLEDARDEAEKIEGDLMEIALECGLSHYNGGGEMEMAASVMSRDDMAPELIKLIKDETVSRVKSEMFVPLPQQMRGKRHSLQTSPK